MSDNAKKRQWEVICTNGRQVVSVEAERAEPISGQSGVIFYDGADPVAAFYCIDGYFDATLGGMHRK